MQIKENKNILIVKKMKNNILNNYYNHISLINLISNFYYQCSK